MEVEAPSQTSAAPAGGSEHARAGDICVIVNNGSGERRGEERADELAAHFRHLPVRAEIRAVAKGSAIALEAERAISEGFGTIVAAGGDGTICAVASRLAGSGRRLGVLPLGTFNYFARSLDLPQELDEAVRVLVKGRSAPINIGEVNGAAFLNNASLGVYPSILRRRERLYRRWGRSRIAAYWSVVTALLRFRSPLRLKVTVDGRTLRRKTPLVFVANNAYQLELFGLEGADCIRSDRFALIVAPDCSRFELVLFAIRLVLGAVKPARDFELFCGREIVVEDRLRRRLIARDGERELMEGPFRFRLREGALEVIVPAGRV